MCSEAVTDQSAICAQPLRPYCSASTSFSQGIIWIILQPHDALSMLLIYSPYDGNGRPQWPPCLGCRSVAARLLRLWVRIPPGAWISVCCECCVLSGRGLCDELVTRPEECYRLWCVVVCGLENSCTRRPWPTGGCRAQNKQTNQHNTVTPPPLRLLIIRDYIYVILVPFRC